MHPSSTCMGIDTTGTSYTCPVYPIPKLRTAQFDARRLLYRRWLLVVRGYTDKWILRVYGILLPGLRRQRTMPLPVTIRHCGTLCIPATGHDLDPLILADRSGGRTTGGPARSVGASGFIVRLAGCHVSLTVWCRCRTTQHPATPQQRARRQGGGLRDNVQHRRRVRDRSR